MGVAIGSVGCKEKWRMKGKLEPPVKREKIMKKHEVISPRRKIWDALMFATTSPY